MDYINKSYKLAPKTINNLNEIKRARKQSWNLTFWHLIKLYNNSMKIKGNKIIFDIKNGDACPHCKVGIIRIKNSRYGQFFGCDQFPHCGFTQNIKSKLDIGQAGFKDN